VALCSFANAILVIGLPCRPSHACSRSNEREGDHLPKNTVRFGKKGDVKRREKRGENIYRFHRMSSSSDCTAKADDEVVDAGAFETIQEFFKPQF
jgi:hypothetical protein